MVLSVIATFPSNILVTLPPNIFDKVKLICIYICMHMVITLQLLSNMQLYVLHQAHLLIEGLLWQAVVIGYMAFMAKSSNSEKDVPF